MALTLVVDATLWENDVVFERGRDDFFAWLAHPDEAHARALREEIETADVAVHGHGSAVFLRTLHDVATYRAPAAEPALDPDADVDAPAVRTVGSLRDLPGHF